MMDRPFAISSFTLPAIVAGAGTRLPQWPHSVALVVALNAAAALRVLPDDTLALLEGKLFLVRVLDAGIQARFTFRGGLFRPVLSRDREPDLHLAANASAFMQLLARQEDPDTLFFRRELAITGDTELGLIVKNMLDAIEWSRLSDLLRRPFGRFGSARS